MESPSIQISRPAEESLFNIDGPPSSPFVSEVETASRTPSRQHQPSFEDIHMDAIEERDGSPSKDMSPSKESMIDFTDIMDDKENIPAEPIVTKINISPKKQSTPEPAPVVIEAEEQPQPADERRDSVDMDLMPPPSTRKTPKKHTPLRALRNGGNTPRPSSRGNSSDGTDRSPERTPAQFQAGLDFRASSLHPGDATNVDDTCFSDFSQVPEMTLFAKLGQSATKQRGDFTRTPGRDYAATPQTSRKRISPSRSPSPTPRRQKTPGTIGRSSDDTTNFLIDFTEQIQGISRPSASPSKSATQPNLLQYMNDQRSPHKARHSMATPAKQSNLMNLLDFELPPAPTPRSVPTITVRELESLKSSYLSQISSLKATLSGREAEVESLKRAVGDAEKRVGEAQESLRDEKNRREHAEMEKAGWEKRGQEVEAVLHNVKEEVLKGEAEKDELVRKVEEGERRAEDAEARAVKAEERFADSLAARADSGDSSAKEVQEQVERIVASQIDAKIEAVSRELHAVYKDKHERKVGTLKKSYEARSEKKCAELQNRLDKMERENADLLAAKDATFSGPVPEASSGAAEAELKAELEEHKAHLARLENEMYTSHQQQDQIMRELQQERIEKGDLVAAVDEMLALQAENAQPQQAQGALNMVEDFRKSISRPSGLKPPGAAASGIGKGLGRGSGAGGGKSRMLANIERMGRTGGGAGANEQ